MLSSRCSRHLTRLLGRIAVSAVALFPTLVAAQRGAPSSVVAVQMRDLDQLLRQGRSEPGSRATAQLFRQRYRVQVRNPFQLLLQRADSLAMRDAQAYSIALINRAFSRASDSIGIRMSIALAGLPDRYDINDAWRLVTDAHDSIATRLVTYAADALDVLNTAQRDRLPLFVRRTLDPLCIRSSVRWFDPAGNGGAGASGIGRPVGC
jgi:hypothetical protein